MSDPLPIGRLNRQRLAISMSDSHDLAQLGLTEAHVNLVLGEVARAVLIAGGTLAYGGHLRSDGFTGFLLNEVERYGPLDYPALLVCLAWQNHRALTLRDLDAQRGRIEAFADLVFLDPHGNEVDPESGRGDGIATVDDDERAPALTAMRVYLEQRSDARLAIGGKRRDFEGRMPGLVEELILAVEQRKPLYLAGGFGGATIDAARVLGAGDTSWFPQPSQTSDPHFVYGLTELARVRDAHNWSLDNGLNSTENDRLIATPRPSEIASLVAVGLYRRFN